MKTQIETCSRCGKHITGKANLGFKDGFIQGGSKSILNDGLDLIIPGLGTISKLTGLSDKAGRYIRDNVTTHTDFEFVCPCGYRWITKIKNTDEHIPDEILQRQKDEAISRFQNKASSNLTWAIVFGLIFCLFLWYLISNPAYIEIPTHNWWTGEDFMRKDIQWGWVGMCFLAIIFFVPTISKFHSYKERKNDVKRLQRMSLKNFKNSEYRK